MAQLQTKATSSKTNSLDNEVNTINTNTVRKRTTNKNNNSSSSSSSKSSKNQTKHKKNNKENENKDNFTIENDVTKEKEENDEEEDDDDEEEEEEEEEDDDDDDDDGYKLPPSSLDKKKLDQLSDTLQQLRDSSTYHMLGTWKHLSASQTILTVIAALALGMIIAAFLAEIMDAEFYSYDS